MKKLIGYGALLASSAVAGLFIWRKVESDRLENDLWAEAEKLSDQQIRTEQKVGASQQA